MPETAARACPNCKTPLPTYAAFCYACGAATPAGIDRTTGEFVVPETSGITMDEVLLKLRRLLGPTYELGARIGAGGFAEVFLAKDLRLKREVAVKVTRPDFALNAQMMQRFRREAEVIAALRHPHIMPIYDIGEADGIAYIVMPYIRGESLKARLDRDGKVPTELARRILLQVGDALHEAHAAGVVHRDVKPDNVMLDRREDQVLLMDFGIAKAAEASADGSSISLTSTGLVMGTPHYMSPEQAAGERTVDARADQYALAVVAYRMIAGALPFDGPSVRAILAKQLVGAATPLRQAAPDAPPALAMAIERAMSKDPDDRYPTVKAFLDAVRADPHYAAEVLRTTGGVPPYTPHAAVPAVAATSGARSWLWMAATLLIVGGVGAAFWLSTGNRTATTAALTADTAGGGARPDTLGGLAAGAGAANGGDDAVVDSAAVAAATPADSAALADSATLALRRDSADVRKAGLAYGTPAALAYLKGLALHRQRSCESRAASATSATRGVDATLACAAALRQTPDRPTLQRALGTLAERAGKLDSAAAYYQLASDRGDVESTNRLFQLVDQGRVAGDAARAAALLRKAADAGNVPAQRELAGRLARGAPGIAKDEGSALTWYGRAAGAGDAASMLALGNMYKDGRGVRKSEADAVNWWQKAAAQGDTAAQYRLGMAYLRNEGVPEARRDQRELRDSLALQWHRRAAERGHGGSQYELRKRGKWQ
ncbi:protein kinase [Roseisolibacter sp. H3M3-2]|uniref:protein kinase domain-containing protein n=1 Tax=Roseisolibacter sp. H3M3-2 TaxID=3031323 RepID=UPI0023D9DAD5|nr:protein kinase [Roseisolibacter sp. H3M3-2]MDF1505278.1 protein kinase [Roseisolibacter sp. H3M3-2]